MANPGKNKLMRFMRLYVDGYNISGDARTFSSLGVSLGEVDMTGWSNTIRQLLSDRRIDAAISGFQAFFNDTAASGSYPRLNNPQAGMEVMINFGGDAEPENGDPSYMMAAQQMTSNISWDAQAGLINADFRIDSAVANADNPLGYVLHGETSLSATTLAPSINNGAASTNGWHAILQVIASSGGTWVFKVRHSVDNSVWADLGTFVLNGSVIGSEHIGGTGTVNQYVRFEATRTSGTVTPVVSFARN